MAENDVRADNAAGSHCPVRTYVCRQNRTFWVVSHRRLAKCLVDALPFSSVPAALRFACSLTHAFGWQPQKVSRQNAAARVAGEGLPPKCLVDALAFSGLLRRSHFACSPLAISLFVRPPLGPRATSPPERVDDETFCPVQGILFTYQSLVPLERYRERCDDNSSGGGVLADEYVPSIKTRSLPCLRRGWRA